MGKKVEFNGSDEKDSMGVGMEQKAMLGTYLFLQTVKGFFL